MRRTQARLLALMLGLIAFVIIAALLYQVGMSRLEGKHRTFWEALEWSAESLSTTGYGADSRWSHPAMVILVVLVQFVGVFLVFLIIPIYLLPFLAERFEQRLPRTADPKLTGHVVVYRYGPAVESLLQRLRGAGVPTLVVEVDEDEAREAAERGESVVFTRSDEDALEVCRLTAARAVVANGTDQENAALVLRARQMGFAGEVYAFVEDPAHRKAMELAGATSAYTPRHIIAAALAAHASDRISPRLPGLERVRGLERREIRVPAGSPLAGKTLAEARLPVIVVGTWSRSQLGIPCVSDTRIEPSSVLEVVGDGESIERAATLLAGTTLRQAGPFLIAGYGEVGRKVHELLRDVEEDVRVIERREGPGVDVAGDVLDGSVLQKAGLSAARALVLALDSDDATLFATVIARDLARDVPIIARVNHARNLENIHRAGADYALSISGISGEMLSARLLGRSVRARPEHRRVTPIAAGEHAGRTIAELPYSIVIALSRGETTLRVTPATRVEPGDVLWVCASS